MAYPVQITLGTGNKVSVNYQSQEVNVSVTYQLERGENDLLAVAREKASEVVAAHGVVWAKVRGEVANETREQNASTPGNETEQVIAEENEAPPEVHQSLLSGGQLAAIEALLVQAGWSQTQVEDHLLEEFGKSELSELSGSQATQLLLELQRDERQRIQSNSQNRRLCAVNEKRSRVEILLRQSTEERAEALLSPPRLLRQARFFVRVWGESTRRRRLGRHFLLELLHELQERHVKSETEIAELHQVETALAHFAFADVGLGAAQTLRQTVLRETGAFAGGTQ